MNTPEAEFYVGGFAVHRRAELVEEDGERERLPRGACEVQHSDPFLVRHVVEPLLLFGSIERAGFEETLSINVILLQHRAVPAVPRLQRASFEL